MLLPGLVLGPFSAMALVHSLLGAYVIIDAKKQSATFQQGVLGLGLGTVELAPFWEIERLGGADLPRGGPTPRGRATWRWSTYSGGRASCRGSSRRRCTRGRRWSGCRRGSSTRLRRGGRGGGGGGGGWGG